jgi:DnaK suppressor protein
MREKLLKLRKDIESIAAIGDESESIVELDQAKVGRLSRMDALQGQAMAKASGQRREIMLRNIDAALKRIDNGDYGICRDCEHRVPKQTGRGAIIACNSGNLPLISLARR